MKTVAVSRRLNVPAGAAWNVVRTGADMERWVPAITACRLEGSGPGARRVCTIQGEDLVESIETVDEANRLFQYRIHEQTLMPVRSVLGTLHVTATGAAESEVLWFVSFDMDDEKAWPAVKAGIEGMYHAGLEGLEARARET